MKRVTIINELVYEVDERIATHVFHSRQSSNIDLFGINWKGSEFFVQFKNGTSYLFSEVPDTVLTEAVEADSIGRFFNANITKKFPSTKFEFRLVNQIITEENTE